EELEKYFDDGQLELLKSSSEVDNISGKDFVHMTKFCFEHSKYINAVSKRHQEVSSKMFPEFNIDYITNGVHTRYWAGEATSEFFDQYAPGWKTEPENLKSLLQNAPAPKILEVAQRNKSKFFKYVHDRYG